MSVALIEDHCKFFDFYFAVNGFLLLVLINIAEGKMKDYLITAG